MKKKNNILIKVFHSINLILIILYLYPASIFGYILYGNSSIQPKITIDYLLISFNHFYAFILITVIDILAYRNTTKINFVLKYLLSLSIFLEFFHKIIPNRSFELKDLIGNIAGVLTVVIIYKIIKKYE